MQPARFAINARNLLDARRQGLMPAGPVHVSLIGGDFDPEPVLYVRDDMAPDALDWQMLVNVDVELWGSTAVPVDRLVGTALRIARAKPHSLFVRFEDGRGGVHDVDAGQGNHHAGAPAAGIAPEHSFWWHPINTCGSALGFRLEKALWGATNRESKLWN